MKKYNTIAEMEAYPIKEIELRRWKDYMSRKTVHKRHKPNPEIEEDRYDY